MGCGCSKKSGVIPFKPFDAELIDAIDTSCIRLLDADKLRQGGLVWLAPRQDLESRDNPIFLDPSYAAAALRTGERRVCFVTHAWRTFAHPDPDGATLTALLRFLRHPLGANVVGVFVDFACLFQPPRDAVQESKFQTALSVMAHAFASPTGTMVARCDTVPPCPADLAAVIAVRGPLEAADAVRAVLVGDPVQTGDGTEETERTVESLEFIPEKDIWRAELGNAADVPSALAAIAKAPPAPKAVPAGGPPPAAAPPPAGARKKRTYCCSCLPQRAQMMPVIVSPRSTPAGTPRSGKCPLRPGAHADGTSLFTRRLFAPSCSHRLCSHQARARRAPLGRRSRRA